MKKKIAIGTLLLSTINPAFADDIAPPPIISSPVGLHTQIGNNVVIELSELNSKITNKRSVVNSISGELVPTSSVMIDRYELIGGGKPYMSACYNISDMIFENAQVAQMMYTNCVNNGYHNVENELTFLMHKYQAKDSVFVFSKPIKIKNKMMQSGYEIRYLEARVLYRNGDSESFRSGIIVSPSMLYTRVRMTLAERGERVLKKRAERLVALSKAMVEQSMRCADWPPKHVAAWCESWCGMHIEISQWARNCSSDWYLLGDLMRDMEKGAFATIKNMTRKINHSLACCDNFAA